MRCPRFSQAAQAAHPIEVFRADINDQQLILNLVQNPSGLRKETSAFTFSQLTQKDTVLHMLTVVEEQFVEMTPSLVTGAVRKHVIGAQIETSIVAQRTTGHGKFGISPLIHRARRRDWMRRMVRHEQR